MHGKKFLRFWQKSKEQVVGLAARHHQLALALLEREGNRWRLTQQQSWDFSDAEAVAVENLEQVTAFLGKLGAVDAPLVLCLEDEESAVSYVKHFPAMPPKELIAAVRWDLEASMSEPSSDFLFGSLTQDNDERLLFALDKKRAEEVQQALQQAGLHLSALTVYSDVHDLTVSDGASFWRGHCLLGEWSQDSLTQAALSVAAAFAFEEQEIFFADIGEGFDPWHWGRIALTLGTIFLGASFLVGSMFLWRLVQEENDHQEIRNQLQNLAVDAEEMQDTNTRLADIEKREKALASLIEKSLPVRHHWEGLGAQTETGVALEHVGLDEKQTEYTGKAIAYAPLSSYAQNLARRLPHAPLLETTQKEDGIAFRLHLEKEVAEKTAEQEASDHDMQST